MIISQIYFSSQTIHHIRGPFDLFNEVISKVKELNQEITHDKSLGKGFCIGHSYFCNQKVCTKEWLHSIIDYDLLPMLQEYWFDDEAKVQKWESIFKGVFHD